jgi:plastocyanin
MNRFYTTFFLSIITLFASSQITHTVTAGNFYYNPTVLTIDVGDSVAWTNDGGFHDVNGDIETTTGQPYNNPVTFDSPSTSGSFIFGYRFTVPGTYNYDCSVGSHAANGMVGTIIVQSLPSTDTSLVLKGIIDFDLPSGGSTGKALHIYANNSISDLSDFGVGVANNGGGSDGMEYIFPSISVSQGDHILLARDTGAIASYFGTCYSNFNHFLNASSDISQNGDDAIELFYNGNVIETFGDINVDGSGQSWEYTDSWAYKDASGNWSYGGPNCTDGDTSTISSNCPYPICVSTTNVFDDALNSKITVYPNPSDEIINIISDESIIDISIYNMLGKKLLEKSVLNKECSIEINGLKRDIYLLKVSTLSGEDLFKKIIKN